MCKQDRQCVHNVTLRCVHITIILYCHLWSGWHFFPHYLIDRTFFGKKVTEKNIRVLIFSTILFKTLLILRRILWEIIVNVHRSSCKLPVILVRFQSNMNFLNRFSKNTQISNFTKIHPGGAELLQTDMTKLIVVFCKVCKIAYKSTKYYFVLRKIFCNCITSFLTINTNHNMHTAFK